MRCENCGTELPEGARFCYMCASPVAVREDGAEEAGEAAGAEVAGAEPAAAVSPEGVASAVAAEDVPASVSDAPVDELDGDVEEEEPAPAAIPAPVKLEGPLPVAAVPFVPMAPAPRSTYVQRRVTPPVRSVRPGANSAPTIASGYQGGAWPQNSAWSLGAETGGPATPAHAAGGPASADESENPIGNVKNKLTRAFDSWGASSAARSEKKRQEREIREAARKVQEQERAVAREAEDRARREAAAKAAREEKERLEREALAARLRPAAPAVEEEVSAEPQVDDVVEAASEPAAEVVAATPGEEAYVAATVAEVEPAPEAEAAVVEAPAPEPAAAPETTPEPEPADEPAEATCVMKPVSAERPSISVPDMPEMPTSDDNYIETGDVTGFWEDAAEDELDAESTGHLDGARRQHSEDGPSMNGYAFTARNRHQSKKLQLAIGIAVVAVLLIGVGTCAAFLGTPGSKETPQLKPSTELPAITQDTSEETDAAEATDEVAVKATVEDYAWSDLSKISAQISAATSETDALTIAKKYNLCSSTGTLDGTQAKSLRLTDGTTVQMRIVGFWQDLKSDGTGHAGISMLADGSVANMPLSESSSDANWGTSSLRTWLNGEFIELLPTEVKEALVSVSKQTNLYTSNAEQEATDDKVWIISYSELVGTLDSGSYRFNTYSNEGSQYQLFADAGVTWSEANSAMVVDGDCVNWWTRSADTANAERIIAPRNEDGYPGYSRNPTVSGEVGVVPGFCL